MNQLRQYIAARRKELNLSQRELATLSDLPLGTVAGIESGRMVKSPRPATLEKLAIGLKTTYFFLDALVRGVEEPVMKKQLRWEEDYYYKLFDAMMNSDKIPETERMMLLAKLRTMWQTYGDFDIDY
jgi:transcriptional regulator with XRE-family HTH domain